MEAVSEPEEDSNDYLLDILFKENDEEYFANDEQHIIIYTMERSRIALKI